MKSILHPSFRYTASFDTDLSKTFARIRRDQCEDTEKALLSVTEHANGLSIVEKTGTDK